MKIGSLSKRESKNLVRILIALAYFFCAILFDHLIGFSKIIPGKWNWLFPFIIYLIDYIFIAYDVLWKAIRNISNGQVFDENFLMCIATIGAFGLAISRGLSGVEIEGFEEACAVILFYQVGEFFQRYAIGKSRKDISSLLQIRPDYANLLKEGNEEQVDPSDVHIGDFIIVHPGEKIPLDGTIQKGTSTLDTKALTGESIPREVASGDRALSGTVNLTSDLEIQVEKEFYDSTVSKILDLVENASEQKSKAEFFITKFARYYTPVVVFFALGLGILPPLFFGLSVGNWSTWSDWVYRALSFLVVSCPCALVISIPLSFFAGIGASSRHGILVKGSNYLERFREANIFVFDKTGTLTKGNFVVSNISPKEKQDRILYCAAIAENHMSHPIAKSIEMAYGKEPEDGYTITNESGYGVIAEKEDESTDTKHVILCGNAKLLKKYNISFEESTSIGTTVYVAENGEFLGTILIRDEIKEESKEVISKLNTMHARTVMLTGDSDGIASFVAKELGIKEYYSSLLPAQKVEKVEALLQNKAESDVLCFVGDGINDAPVLMRSDIGIAMGGVGSDAAIEASDIVLMKDNLRGIPLAKKIAKSTMKVVYQNIYFSLAIKFSILILAALGITGMWISVFGDVGVAVLAILNAMRVNKKYE